MLDPVASLWLLKPPAKCLEDRTPCLGTSQVCLLLKRLADATDNSANVVRSREGTALRSFYGPGMSLALRASVWQSAGSSCLSSARAPGCGEREKERERMCRWACR
jgi:hypothetical protein